MFSLDIPFREMPELDLPHQSMWSDTQFDIIKKYIEQYESSLDNDHEVGVMLTNFGQSVIMQVTEIGYEESVVMVFKGFVNGKQSTLIQHINQLNFLLTSVDKAPDKPKRKIGFYAPEENE
jgi:hypothetical protein